MIPTLTVSPEKIVRRAQREIERLRNLPTNPMPEFRQWMIEEQEHIIAAYIN